MFCQDFCLCFQKVAINKAVQTLSQGNSFFPPVSSFSSHSTLHLTAARRVFDAFDARKYKYSEERKPVKQLQVLIQEVHTGLIPGRPYQINALDNLFSTLLSSAFSFRL